MQGTGTSQDPYIIMTAEDLYAMGDLGNSEAVVSLGADIDFNNTPYAENFQPIPMNCKIFCGNHHTIRNVNYINHEENASLFNVSSEYMIIENITTENIRLGGKNVFLFGNSGEKCTIMLTHCTIIINEALILSPSLATASNRYCILHDNDIKIASDYCTFAVRMQSERYYPFFATDNVSCCQTRAEIRVSSPASSGTSYTTFVSDSLVSDSYFFLEIKAPETENSGTFDFSSNNSKFSNCYLVCEPSAEITAINWNGTMQSTCFYDSTVIRKNNTDIRVRNNLNSVNFYSLTTEQCKNPVYLRSIGFNCAGAEE